MERVFDEEEEGFEGVRHRVHTRLRRPNTRPTTSSRLRGSPGRARLILRYPTGRVRNNRYRTRHSGAGIKLSLVVLMSQFIFKSRDLFLNRCKIGRGVSRSVEHSTFDLVGYGG